MLKYTLISFIFVFECHLSIIHQQFSKLSVTLLFHIYHLHLGSLYFPLLLELVNSFLPAQLLASHQFALYIALGIDLPQAPCFIIFSIQEFQKFNLSLKSWGNEETFVEGYKLPVRR